MTRELFSPCVDGRIHYVSLGALLRLLPLAVGGETSRIDESDGDVGESRIHMFCLPKTGFELSSSRFADCSEATARLSEKEPPSGKKHCVDNAPSVGVLRCSKNAVDARECFFQQRAKSLNLDGA